MTWQSSINQWIGTAALATACLIASGFLYSPLHAAGETAVHHMMLLDGTELEGQVTHISAEGKITGRGWERPVALNELRVIRGLADNSDKKSPPPSMTVSLIGGGQLPVASVAVADDACRIKWAYDDELVLPIDVLQAVVLRAEADEAERRRILEGEGDEFDRLFVEVDGKPAVLKGYVESISADRVKFDWQGQIQNVLRENVLGLRFATLGDEGTRPGECQVDLQDGSRIVGRIVKLVPDTMVVADDEDPVVLGPGVLTIGVGNAEVVVPWDVVSNVTVFSDRLVYLSELEPTEVIEQPVVTFPRPWQRDRSIGGNTLTLAARTFEKGIGVQSRASLTFDVNREYELLAATIGIDDETDGRGNCEFVVLVDGREVFRRQMAAGDKPHVMRVDISDARRMTLLVEPGEDLDLGDHADWADACVIRPADLE